MSERDRSRPLEPLAGPFYAPPYGPAWTCEGFRRLSVVCDVGGEAIDTLLTNTPFEATGDRIEVFVDDLSNHSLGPFNESGIVVPVVYRGVAGVFHPVMFVGSDVALIAGREVFGYPKLLGDTTWSEREGTVTGVTSRGGREIIRMELALDPDDAMPSSMVKLSERPPDEEWEWTHHLSVKSIPSIRRGEADALQIIYRNIAGRVRRLRPATATLRCADVPELPLGELSVVAAYLIEGDFGGGWDEERRVL